MITSVIPLGESPCKKLRHIRLTKLRATKQVRVYT